MVYDLIPTMPECYRQAVANRADRQRGRVHTPSVASASETMRLACKPGPYRHRETLFEQAFAGRLLPLAQ
jgi:hypothetical protein